jgi:hypothetical protein
VTLMPLCKKPATVDVAKIEELVTGNKAAACCLQSLDTSPRATSIIHKKIEFHPNGDSIPAYRFNNPKDQI